MVHTYDECHKLKVYIGSQSSTKSLWPSPMGPWCTDLLPKIVGNWQSRILLKSAWPILNLVFWIGQMISPSTVQVVNSNLVIDFFLFRWLNMKYNYAWHMEFRYVPSLLTIDNLNFCCSGFDRKWLIHTFWRSFCISIWINDDVRQLRAECVTVDCAEQCVLWLVKVANPLHFV